jgi:hypothetical protein
MDNREKVKDVSALSAKLDGMEKVGDLKYASSRDLSDLVTKVHVQDEKIKGLEQRCNDYISSRRYMTATNISTLSLIIALFTHYFR